MVIKIQVMQHAQAHSEHFQKEQKKKDAMLAALEVGDTILTTSGFYGTIIDISDDTVIVEFGSNKNCRIPAPRFPVLSVRKKVCRVLSYNFWPDFSTMKSKTV